MNSGSQHLGISDIPVRKPINVESPGIEISRRNGASHFLENSIPETTIRAIQSFSVSLPCKRACSGLVRRSSYDAAGLSNDCQHSYYHDENELVVLTLRYLRMNSDVSTFPIVKTVGKDYTSGEPIIDVAMSSSYLVVVTTQRALVINVADNYQIEPIAYADWEPSGVACYENTDSFVLALGQGRGHLLDSSQGQIGIYEYKRGYRS